MATEYKSIAKGLVEIHIVDKRLGEKLMQMAGYGNRLVHMHNLVSDEELYQIIQTDLKDIEEIVSAVESFIQGSIS